MTEIARDPQVWSAAIMGALLLFMTFSARIGDANKKKTRQYKQDSAMLRSLQDYTYLVHTLVFKHNIEMHPDGEGFLLTPPVPEGNNDSD